MTRSPGLSRDDVIPLRAAVSSFMVVAMATVFGLATVLGVFTIGPIAAPFALASVGLLAWRLTHGAADESAFAGALAGFAVLPTWFSYLALGAPGLPDDFAEPLSSSDAWIFITFAVLLVLLSVVAFVVIRRRPSGEIVKLGGVRRPSRFAPQPDRSSERSGSPRRHR